MAEAATGYVYCHHIYTGNEKDAAAAAGMSITENIVVCLMFSLLHLATSYGWITGTIHPFWPSDYLAPVHISAELSDPTAKKYLSLYKKRKTILNSKKVNQ